MGTGDKRRMSSDDITGKNKSTCPKETNEECVLQKDR